MSAVLITSVSGGTCVTRTGNLVNNQTRSSAPAQQWILEQGPTTQSFAFRNVETGDYLHANKGAASAAIGIGPKQFWSLTPGAAAGSCFVQCQDYPNAFLTSKSGSHHNGNVVYCWPKQDVWTHALTWYLHDAHTQGFMPVGQTGQTAQASKLQEAALQTKEAEAMVRDAQVATREAALKKAEAAMAAKQTELQNIEAKLAEKENEMASRQTKLDGVRADTIDTTAKVNELSIKEAALKEREDKLSKQEAALRDEREHAKFSAAPNGTTTSAGSDLKAENARLKAEVERLNNQHPFKLSPRTERGLRSREPPHFKLNSTFDPVLLKRFEEGRKVVRGSMRPLAT